MLVFDVRDLPESLSNRISVCESTQCWLWTGRLQACGYARIGFEGRVGQAHRFVYEILVGEIDPSLHCDHLCRVRQCVNPAHIEPVTQLENLHRGDGAKIDFETAEEIRRRYHNNPRVTQQSLAHEFGISRTSVSFITRGLNWSRSGNRVARSKVKNRRHILTDREIDLAKKLLDEGQSQRAIGKKLNCSNTTIFKIAHDQYRKEGASS